MDVPVYGPPRTEVATDPQGLGFVAEDAKDVKVSNEKHISSRDPSTVVDVKYVRPYRFFHNQLQFWRARLFTDVNTYVSIQSGTLSNVNEYIRFGNTFPLHTCSDLITYESWLTNCYLLFLKWCPNAASIYFWLYALFVVLMFATGWLTGTERNSDSLRAAWIFCIILSVSPLVVWILRKGFVYLRSLNAPRLRHIEDYDKVALTTQPVEGRFRDRYRRTIAGFAVTHVFVIVCLICSSVAMSFLSSTVCLNPALVNIPNYDPNLCYYYGPTFFWAYLACTDGNYTFPSHPRSRFSDGLCSPDFLPSYRAFMVFNFLAFVSVIVFVIFSIDEWRKSNVPQDVAEVWVWFKGAPGYNVALVEASTLPALTKAFIRCKQIEMENTRIVKGMHVHLK